MSQPHLVLCELGPDTRGIQSLSPYVLKVHRALQFHGLAYERRHALRPSEHKEHNPSGQVLLPFVGYPRHDQPEGLPFRLTDYLELVDWSGRILRDDKRGAIPEKCPPILERLNIEPKHWLYMTSHFESRFQHLVGAAQRLKQACRQLGYQRTPGLRAATELLN